MGLKATAGYPRFVTPLYGKTVQEGQAMFITCEVEGKPTPEVFWTLNGRTIEKTSTHIQQSFDGKQATLTVLKIFTDDEGEYCCRAFNSCGAATSRCYVRVLGQDAPPSAPSCIEAIDATRDYVMLTWKPPGYIGHFGGAPVDGYIVETCEAGSCLWKPWSRDPVKLTKTPVTGLGEDKVYFFRVRSFNRWGTSPPSQPTPSIALRDAGSPRLPEELEDASKLLPPETQEPVYYKEEEVPLPETPSQVTATLSPEGCVINITWTEPVATDSAGPVDGYLIESLEEGGEEWKTETSQPLKTIDPYPVTGLSAGKIYRFRVFSVNSAGCSTPKQCPVPITVQEAERKSEDVSQNYSQSDEKFVESNEAEASLDSEKSEEIVCQTDFENQGEDSTVVDIEEITQATVCIEECENAGNCPKIVVIDEKEQQQQVFEQKHTSEDQKLKYREMRSRCPSPPVDVKELNATREFIVIGWIPPFQTGGDDPRYYVEMMEVGSDSWKICNQSPIEYVLELSEQIELLHPTKPDFFRLTHYPVTGVTAGASYIFRVRAITKHGTSQFSDPSEVIVADDGIKPPNWWGGVQGLFRVADDKGKPCISKNSVKVCWDSPTTDGGSPVTGYYLEYRPAGGKFKPVNNKPLNQRHFTVDGLTAGVEYEFRICACNIVGSGGWKMLPGRILAKDPEPPSYPTDLLITSLSDESVSLKWKEPKYTGDASMVGYVVERCKEGSDIWIPCNRLPEDVKEGKYKVDGLVTGQTYFFRVKAVNKVGTGEPSLMSCFVTPGEEWELVDDRQNAMLEVRRKKEEEELARKRALEEEERKQAFVSGIENSSVKSGEKAYFECTVKDPTTNVKWCLGNDQEILLEPVGKYDIVHVGDRRSLGISNCQYSDIQLVHCIALYNNCSTSACCIVDEIAPVVFAEKPEDIYIKSGETSVFSYTLARDDAKVKWYKNGVEIDEDDEHFEIIASGNTRSLFVKDATVRDSASYTIAGYGGSFTTHLVVDGILPAHFSSPICGGEYGHEEGVAELEAVIVPSALYKDGNEPQCLWYHNGERVEEGDDKYQMVNEGNRRILKILNLNHEDSGEIVCKCGGDETRCEIEVERPPPPPPKIPVLQEEDAAINFVQGLRSEALPGSIRLYCVLEKLRDDVKIIWYKNDIEIDINGKEFNCIIDRDTGLVSLVFNNLTAELADGTYTCEFITIHSIFDTKVNFTFAEAEFDKVYKMAMKLKEDEERERQERIEERRRKRAELRKKREEEEKIKRETAAVPTEPTTTEEQSELTCDGITYGVDRVGQLVLGAEVNGLDSKAEVTWLKNSLMLEGERYSPAVMENVVELTIKDLTEDDCGTYTCKIKTKTSSAELSIDVTGKVFSDLLTKSESIRETLIEKNENYKGTDESLQKDQDEDLVTVLRHESENISQRLHQTEEDEELIS